MPRTSTPPPRMRFGRKRPDKWTAEAITQLADELREWYEDEDNLFLAKFLGERNLHWDGFHKLYIYDKKQADRERSPDTLELKKARNYLANTVKICKTLQEARIVERGMNSRNPSMSIFMLKCHHNYQDKVVIAGDQENPLVIKKVGIDGDKI